MQRILAKADERDHDGEDYFGQSDYWHPVSLAHLSDGFAPAAMPAITPFYATPIVTFTSTSVDILSAAPAGPVIDSLKVAGAALGIAVGEGDSILIGDPVDYSNDWTTEVGDINGDGIEDTLVAKYSYDEATATSSNSTTVVFGGSDGQGFVLTEHGKSINGWSVSAAGDVNGDGRADLLVSTYDYDAGTSAKYVVFGGADLGPEVDVAALDAAHGFQIEAGGGYSYVATVGDVNGDGCEDLLVNTYDYANGTSSNYLLFGGADGTKGFELPGGDANTYSYISAAGDVNGDGRDDLLVSSYDYASGASSTYLVFGAADGLGDKLQLVTGGEDAYAWVSAAGDANGDGFADLTVGTYDYASGEYGEYVVYGAAAVLDIKAQLATILSDYPLGSG